MYECVHEYIFSVLLSYNIYPLLYLKIVYARRLGEVTALLGSSPVYHSYVGTPRKASIFLLASSCEVPFAVRTPNTPASLVTKRMERDGWHVGGTIYQC